jgi:hypothetical protein
MAGGECRNTYAIMVRFFQFLTPCHSGQRFQMMAAARLNFPCIYGLVCGVIRHALTWAEIIKINDCLVVICFLL